jgi:uncharacterized protein YndB with AHSA1/START domain
MMEFDTVSRIHIACSPQEAYDFVTRPDNWVGTHPVTAAVKGAPDGRAGAGQRWVETIKGPGMPAFDAEWSVVRAEPPALWEIRCEKLGPVGAEVTITYTFTPEAGGVRFDRLMVSRFGGGIEPPDEVRAALRDSAVHELYLRAVKTRIEERRALRPSR